MGVSPASALQRWAALGTLRAQKLLWLLRRREAWMLRFGIAPSIEHAELLRGRRFRSVVDVGANVGQFAVWARVELGAERVVCVEPQRHAARTIRRVAARSTGAIDVIEAALGAEPRRACLYVTAANDSSSLLEPGAWSSNTGALRVRREEDVAVLTGDVALREFDLPGPLLVKIDVQGTEAAVLLGMPELLARADAVLVEVSFVPMYHGQSDPSEVVETLLVHGLRLAGAARVPGTGGMWKLDQADLLFERPR